MDSRKLEVFCKVVEYNSFTKAAETLFISQPTVSEHVRGLESELGQKLFSRLGREVELTPAGEILYKYALEIIRKQEEAVQAIAQYSGSLTGKLSIGCGTIPGTYLLPNLINSFHKAQPSAKTILRISSSKIIAQQVLAGEIDFGIVGAKWNEKKLTWLEIFKDELTLIVHPEHVLAKEKEISLSRLSEFPFVLREPESGTRRVFATILERAGHKESELKVVAEIGSTAAVKEAVKAGIGVSVISKLAALDDLDCGKLATLSIRGYDLYRPFFIVQRKMRELSPVAATFIRFLENQLSTSDQKV